MSTKKITLGSVALTTALILSGCNLFSTSSSDSAMDEAQQAAIIALAKVPAGNSCLPPPAGLAGWWTGDNTTADNSPFANNAVLKGDATFAPGYIAQSFATDPVGDYIEAGHIAALTPANNLTLEAWIFLAENTYYPAIINKGDVGTANESYALFLDSWGKLGFLLNSNGTFSGRTMHKGPTLPFKQWVHVAGTYDGSLMRLYINGDLVGSKPHYGGIHPTTNPLIIGLLEKSTDLTTLPSLHGQIEEPTVYDRTLSGAEIQALFDAGMYGKCKEVSHIAAQIIERAETEIVQLEQSLLLTQDSIKTEIQDVRSDFKSALAQAKLEPDMEIAKQLRRDAITKMIEDMKAAFRELKDARQETKDAIAAAEARILEAEALL